MPASSQSLPDLSADRYAHALLTLQSLYDDYVATSIPAPLDTIVSTFLASLIRVQPYVAQLTSLFTSLISSLSGAGGGGSAESTALISTAVLIITLYLSLRVFNYVRRMVLGWIVLLIKLVVVLVGVQVVIYVNKYGWENAIRDASWWGGLVWGFVEEILEGSGNGTNARAPRGTRSRASAGAGRRSGNSRYAYNGREQMPAGAGRTRWT